MISDATILVKGIVDVMEAVDCQDVICANLSSYWTFRENSSLILIPFILSNSTAIHN